MAAVLPRNLALAVQRLANFNRTTIRVRPQSNDAVGSGQTMVFRLPTNTLVDLHNIQLFGECGILGDRIQGFPELMHECIERLDVVANGQVITGSNSDYGGLYALLSRNLRTSHHRMEESVNELERGGPRGFDVDGVLWRENTKAVAATDISDYGNGTTAGRKFPFTIAGFLGFLSGHYVRFIDTAVTGPMEIRIRLAPSSILWESQESDHLGSYALKTQYNDGQEVMDYEWRHMYMILDTISFTDDMYRAILANRLASGGIITIPYQNFFSYMRSVSNSDSVTFNVASQSLDMLMASFRDSGYSRRDAKKFSEQARDTNYYKFVSGRNNRDSYYNSDTTYQFLVNNLHAPSWPANVNEAKLLTANAFDIAGDVTNIGQNQLDVNYENGGFVFAQCFMHHGETDKIISGLDTRGASSNMQFDVHNPETATRYDNSAEGVQIDNSKLICTIWAATTSTLEISAGQNITTIF